MHKPIQLNPHGNSKSLVFPEAQVPGEAPALGEAPVPEEIPETRYNIVSINLNILVYDL